MQIHLGRGAAASTYGICIASASSASTTYAGLTLSANRDGQTARDTHGSGSPQCQDLAAVTGPLDGHRLVWGAQGHPWSPAPQQPPRCSGSLSWHSLSWGPVLAVEQEQPAACAQPGPACEPETTCRAEPDSTRVAVAWQGQEIPSAATKHRSTHHLPHNAPHMNLYASSPALLFALLFA